MLCDTTHAFRLFFQLVHLHGQKNIPGDKIPNLHLKKLLRFTQSPIVIKGRLLHLLFERIGACLWPLGSHPEGVESARQRKQGR